MKNRAVGALHTSLAASRFAFGESTELVRKVSGTAARRSQIGESIQDPLREDSEAEKLSK